MTDTIYARPAQYDLEHEGDDADVLFYLEFVRRFRPRRMLELGCGGGRVTVPLAAAAPTIGVDTR
ncbi:MAG: hypothetical protein ACM3NQ_01090 [Bacteroidales bacterium]